MPDTLSRGLPGLCDLLDEQVVRGGTGAIAVGDRGVLFMVFGHPLHATHGDLEGLSAVDAIVEEARADPAVAVAWTPGRTAGRAHSLEPGDAVLQRLRSPAGRPPDDGPSGATPAAATAEARWSAVTAEVCAAMEASLHRHARVLTAAIKAAAPEPDALLLAVQRARSLPVRAVSPAALADALDRAEALVRERAGSTPD